MSLSGALQIGRSALLANQVAIEVTGNNLANITTAGYHRQTVDLEPVADEQIQNGVFIGRGVQVQQITRQVDEGLEGRLRSSISDQSASAAQQDVLNQIESLQNELSGNDLSTMLGNMFNAWSQLANNPLDNSVRTVVTQQSQSVASFVQNLRSGLDDLRTQTDKNIDSATSSANDLLTQIEQVNSQISHADQGSGGVNALRDQRDGLLTKLSQYMDVSTVEQPNGAMDVFVGSTPVILNGKSRGLEVKRQTVNGQLQINVVLKSDGTTLQATSGQIGALAKARKDDINNAETQLDNFTNQLIYQVNKVHSQGQGTTGVSSVTGSYKVTDTNAALNDPAAGLAFTPNHGSFDVTVKQVSTGQLTSSTINVDLDNVDTANNTSLSSLVAQLNAVPNLTASITTDGRLKVDTNGGDFQVSFGNDSSGALAALGVNTFFTGTNGSDIAVNNVIVQTPGLIAAGQDNVQGDNSNALAMAALQNQAIPGLNGLSLSEAWSRNVEDYASRLGQANQKSQADTLVTQNLQTQQQAVSGVNTDEEAINLLSYQRAYQGSARFVSVVDQMLQTLLQMT